MATTMDRGKLATEMEELDLPTLKKRRTNARRNATRCETFLREHKLNVVKDLDLKAITSHREKIQQEIATLDAIHDAIMNKLSEVEGEPEEEVYTTYSTKMLGTSNALAELAEAARLYSRCKVIKLSLDRYASLPKLDGCNVGPALSDIQYKLDEMQESAVTFDGYTEVHDYIEVLIRDLMDLQVRNGKDLIDSTPPPSTLPTRSNGLSKFERLPRLALPDFDGTPIGWRPFWEKFQNALSKDIDLTDVDKLAFLNMAVKGKEAKLIIESKTRSGPDYDGAIQALQDRYDQPRQTCRTSLQSVLDHRIDLSSESITKTITLFQTSLAVMKECTDGSQDALFTALCELIMPEKLFQDWVEESAKMKKTPGFDHLAEYLRRYQMRFCGRTDATASSSSIAYKRPHPNRPRNPASLHVQSTKNCPFCPTDTHPLYLCNVFKAQSVEERNSTASRLKVCANCLSFNHFLRECQSIRSCCHCGRKHHSLLHRGNQKHTVPSNSDSTPNTSAHALPSCHTAQDRPRAFLATCLATIGAGGRIQKARALMDSGSTLTFVTAKLAQRLKAKRIKKHTSFTGISQTTVPDSRYQVDLDLIPNSNQPAVSVRAIVLDRISGDLPALPLQGVRGQPFLQGLELADPKFDQPGSVDLLFGIDVLDDVLLNGHATSADRSTHACETIYGWALRGKVLPGPTSDHVHLCGQAEESTDDLLQAFFKVEQAPERTSDYTVEEQQALDHFQNTHSRDTDGRYVVRLPKCDTCRSLGCSRDQALRRHHQNRRSLERKGNYADFEKALREYSLLGHAEPVAPEDLRKPECETFYLPTHGVVKSSSTTTKLRIVFDASATTSTGISLNDVLLPGPNFYPLLTSVMLAFRKHPIALCADISKMFREVGLHPDDRDLHRFLQPEPEGGAIRDMRMNRVTFGVTSSPFLATQVLRQLAHDYKEQYPQAASIVLNNFYVDDCLAGADTLEEAITIRTKLCELLSHAQMNLRKWKTNSQHLQQTIPQELREEESVQLISPPDKCLKTLGIHWDTRTDNLHVATPSLTSDDRPTKRKIASDVSKTFDLLGWFSPCIVVVKILLQKLWKENLAWDEPVPEHLAQEWKTWKNQLSLITNHPIPRYQYVHRKKVRSFQLHGFSDASDVAYAGVVYLRTVYEDATVSITLLYSKTRVAPLKGMTTPRLELCGAQLLSKLLIHVAKALAVPMSNIYAWSDSTIVLCWLSTPVARLKSYVSNRVLDTIGRVPATQWTHVPTASNPADVASRGMETAQLICFQLWWQGPSWLLLPPSQWPCNNDWRSKKDVTELKPAVHLAVPPPEDISERFSSYKVMQRVLTWCFRFACNCRKQKAERVLSPYLSLAELDSTETRLLNLSQERNFQIERIALSRTGEVSRKSALAGLRPFLDPNGLMRVGGRLENASLTTEQKHPIILHHSDRLSKLLARQVHESNMHVGPRALLAILSLQYHIIGFKQLVKGVSNRCVSCQKVYARTNSQVMGQLPVSRVTPTSTFHHTGADFAGPLMVKRGFTRNRTLVKTYVCVFVCMATKAVHLEMVTDLTSEAFLAALRRFIGRRGCPETLATDNGSNFVGAQKELHELYTFLNSSATQKSTNLFCTTHHIKWTHSPARSPHFGGLWEAAVKSMKLLLYKTVKPHNLLEHELYTVLVEVEAALNSRPLIPLESGPADGLEVLTPSHFLVGKALKAVPVEMHLDTKINRLTHWNLCQRIHADFWTRWVKEYLHILQRSNKWCRPERSVKVGDLVLLKDIDLFVRTWPLGRVITVYPGADGYVRAATVKTEKGNYTRAITKFVVLLKEEELNPTSTLGPPVCSGPAAPPKVASSPSSQRL